MADTIRRQVRVNNDIYQETYVEGYYATKDGKVAQIQNQISESTENMINITFQEFKNVNRLSKR